MNLQMLTFGTIFTRTLKIQIIAMVDLSSIITQVKQGETMPTPPAPPQAAPTITDTSKVKKTKTAFGDVVGLNQSRRRSQSPGKHNPTLKPQKTPLNYRMLEL